jgi:hypothetical protein
MVGPSVSGLFLIITVFKSELRWPSKARVYSIQLGLEVVPVGTQLHNGSNRPKCSRSFG